MDVEAQRQRRFLDAVLYGKRQIRDQNDARLFIAATCNEQDRLQCISKLCTGENGLPAARQALLTDLSSSALNGQAAQFIEYFATQELRQIASGRMLYDLLLGILKPSLLWDAYRTAATNHELTETGIHAFATLVSELLYLLPPSSEFASQLQLKITARGLVESNQLRSCESTNVRRLAYRIEEAIRSSALPDDPSKTASFKPGGRHDNDFADFRKISIFPTKDELLSNEPPYMLPSNDVLRTHVERRTATHIDNQFRLLREDMLAELRDDLKHSLDTKVAKRGSLRLRGIQFSGVNCGSDKKPKPPTLALRCYDPAFRKLPESEQDRRKYLVENKAFIKHGLFGCIVASGQVVAFATIDRDEELLAKAPPILLLRLTDEASTARVLTTLKLEKPHEMVFVAIDTPYFAYEPVLRRLQQMPTLPLADVILGLKDHDASERSQYALEHIAERIRSLQGQDISSIIGSPQRICLDRAQTESLIAALIQPVSGIHGPPGTGKSLIGAIAAKLILHYVQSTTVLVLCYTNHALDQFLEDILDMGVSEDQVVRLGSKFSPRTEPMALHNQTKNRVRLPHARWHLCQYYMSEASIAARDTVKTAATFSRWKQTDKDILESLEFNEQDERFYHALSTPEGDEDMSIVGYDGKPIDSTYLFERWSKGRDAGLFKARVSQHHEDIWQMSRDRRQKLLARWTQEAVSERSHALAVRMRDFDADYNKWTSARESRVAEIMKNKRIIGCTTTAAAKYADQIALAKPGVILVEEAGEVLESHILTALSQETKQLIMIGDHLQLRPKVKNYALTVERGDGFDLNCSLFERLISSGHPHTVLAKQHRMRPQISALVRRLMYPNLEDSDSVMSRADMLGLQRNVIFINHEHPEVDEKRLKDRLDENSMVSRQNVFEAKMILKIVKYLAQQGYGTDKQVVLTPYLGQLRLIMDELKVDHDPVLGDLDSHDLVKAGLMTPASAAQNKRQLRISTIDNFQGEESDVVIASLTRSNKHGDIGFMSAAQRLNVLLSRARNGLILIGNAETFKRSKKGSAVWTPFFEQLVQNDLFFDGLPVKCEQHPAQNVVLAAPNDFDVHCPSGGCSLPCRTLLSCGKHRCPEKCHQLVDHSNMSCSAVVETECRNKHRTRRRCFQSTKPCQQCERDSELHRRRQQRQDDYLSKLIAIEDKIALQRAAEQDLKDNNDQTKALKQKEDELVAIERSVQQKKETQVKKDAQRREEATVPSIPAKRARTTHVEDSKSKAANIWKSQKKESGAGNEHIDAIMGLIGLESVKEQVLEVKDKVDISVRQGADLSHERFNAILLGNPGTGKTTVARHYARCLASMGVVSGDKVQETTASKLIHGGVAAYKKMIDELMNDGGGSLFVDEAYQLTSGANSSGRQVLDAVMDDAENLTGKVVFILAGYRKEMEGLLAHNPGLTSRFPYEFGFADYEDDELHLILLQQVYQHFHGYMNIEGGLSGPLTRIAARRVGYGRGTPGFGNARAMENALAKIRTRQAARISDDRRQGKKPDDFMLTKEDVLGPEPSEALKSSKAWETLQSLIGLESVKESIRALMQSLRYNYERELKEEPLLRFNLNRVFLGSPGTGKTTVAKLYGQILAELGLLSNGEVIVKNPSDFVGDVLGASEKTTKGILSSSVGKVLVIDEAYGLYPSSAGQPVDIYKTAVIDTLVAEVQSVPGDDRCVLLLGYQDEMENMLRNANPGLARRFPISEAFNFQDFTDKELAEVVKLKLRHQAYRASDEAMRCIMESLQRARNKLHFGNAGEVDILLNIAKQRHQQRHLKQGHSHNNLLEASDFDEHHGQADLSIDDLFKDHVGHGDLVQRLKQIKKVVVSMKAQGHDPRGKVPYNFVFCGPPGTGKTTTARKMGQIYHDLGILATDEVLEKSASDLVGQYVGHTAHKTKKLLESALGKVLLIDEAYRLASGDFAKEAIDELVDLLTKPTFSRKLIVILAGYDHDIERLMRTNSGLSSRFPEKVPFASLAPESCIMLLISRLTQETYLDTTSIQTLSRSRRVVAAFERLIQIGDWANARDVQNLADLISRDILQAADPSSTESFQVEEQHVLERVQRMIDERQKRSELLPSTVNGEHRIQQFLLPSQCLRQNHVTVSHMPITTAQKESLVAVDETRVEHATERDEGVSDEVWAELMADRQKALDEEELYNLVINKQKEQEQRLQEIEEDESDEEEEEDDPHVQAARRKREQERLRYEQLRRQKEEMEAQQAHEKLMQKKLRMMGVCCAGYQWIKQGNGYRCAGGYHFVADESLNAMTG